MEAQLDGLTIKQEVKIFRQKIERIPQPFSIKYKVGAIKDITSTQSEVEFSIDSFCYHPGEQVKCSVQADNTRCATSIKSFKFKLLRRASFMVDH